MAEERRANKAARRSSRRKSRRATKLSEVERMDTMFDGLGAAANTEKKSTHTAPPAGRRSSLSRSNTMRFPQGEAPTTEAERKEQERKERRERAHQRRQSQRGEIMRRSSHTSHGHGHGHHKKSHHHRKKTIATQPGADDASGIRKHRGHKHKDGRRQTATVRSKESITRMNDMLKGITEERASQLSKGAAADED